MVGATQQQHAVNFRDRHHDPSILMLPCVWDAASARLFEEIGFPAVGTSSGAIAHSLGYPDGQQMSAETMIAAVERITRVVSIPVSVDFEAGYGTTVEEVTRNVRHVIDAGAIGINIEDGTGADADPLVDLDYQIDVIKSIRSLADSRDLPFVVNARTDVFLHSVGERADRFDRAVERANAYYRAGADCLFLMSVSDRSLIADLVTAIEGPLNILAFGPDAPNPSELEKLGVARVSTGSGPMHMSLATVRQFAEQMLEMGEYSAITGERVSRSDFQQWFAPPVE